MRRKSINYIKLLITAVVAVFLFGGYFRNLNWQNLFDNGRQLVEEMQQDEQDKTLYDVVYVIDGDTIIVDIDGKETKVRLIGIDTPESVNADESKNTEEGKLASEFTSRLLDNQKVYLEYDVQLNDKYGRTLAYVYLPDGTMVNEYIIAEGYAYPMTVVPNVKYSDTFVTAYENAVDDNKGLWAQKED